MSKGGGGGGGGGWGGRGGGGGRGRGRERGRRPVERERVREGGRAGERERGRGREEEACRNVYSGDATHYNQRRNKIRQQSLALVRDNELLLRVAVGAEEVDTLLQEEPNLGVGGGGFLFGQDEAEGLHKL